MLDANALAERHYENLRSSELRGMAWKDDYERFKILSHGDVDLETGRRLVSEKSMGAAAYVAQVCHVAWLGRRLPDGKSWDGLRLSLEVVFKELRGE